MAKEHQPGAVFRPEFGPLSAVQHMTEAADLAEIAFALREGREGRAAAVSDSAMLWLANAEHRRHDLVFREVKQLGSAAVDLPVYSVGYADAPEFFSPSSTKQLEPVVYLHLLAKRRGAWVPVDLGRPGQPRRAEMVKRRLACVVDALAAVAPALADELRYNIEAQYRNGKVLMRLSWRANSPRLEV